MALDPLVAQAIGAGESGSVSRAVQRGLVLSVFLSIVTALLLAPAAWVLRAAHQQPDVIPDAARYVQISIAGALPFLAFVVLRQSLQAMHRMAPIVWTVILANVSNASLNWVFVYGHLGSPALGVVGSSVATAISRWLMMLLVLGLGWRELEPALFPFRADSLRLGPLVRMMRIGAPIGAQQALEAGAFGAIGLLMGVLGTVQMAAHQIAISLAAFTFMVPLGVASAAAVRVGHAIGAGDDTRAKAAVRAAYLCGVGFMIVPSVLFLAVPHAFAAAFSGDERVVAFAATLIPIAGVFQIFDGAQAVGAGVLRGAGDTTAPLYVMLGAYWIVGVPVSAYLAFHAGYGAAGLWWGFVVSLAAVALFLLRRIRVVFGRELRRVHIEGGR
jgi:MATE family multidrug resistance protein